MKVEIKSQIIEVLNRSVCTGWDRGFLESIMDQLERGRTLSDKQLQTTAKVIARNDQHAQKLHDEWHDLYLSEHKADAKVLANYYSNTGYFTALVEDILNDIVPDMRAYLKMSGNKYAQGVLRTHRQEPKYPAGTLVIGRANCLSSSVGMEEPSKISWDAHRAATKALKSKGGIILAVVDKIRSHAKGAKMYKILPIGCTIPVIVEERYIKIKRKQIKQTTYGMMDIPPRYIIGNLVRGNYDYMDYYYWYEDPENYINSTHTGVVVEVEYEMEYFQDYVYTVLCLDGVKRFFVESELIKIQP